VVILYLLHHFSRSASSQITKVSAQMHLIVITDIVGNLLPVAMACPVSPDRVLEAGAALPVIGAATALPLLSAECGMEPDRRANGEQYRFRGNIELPGRRQLRCRMSLGT
jgi:hypothetical protein